VTSSAAHDAIETVIRLESARLIAGLARYAGGDLGLAEELAQDAVVAALEQWPGDGVPANPGAWLMTVAKRRAVDQFRRSRELDRKYAEIGRTLEASGDDGTAGFERAISDDIDDDLLRLIFAACHPVLSLAARVALTLRLLGGLTTAEIARAYLVSEPTIAQRIVRAKKTLASANVPSPVVELNRAVAVSMALGPAAGLALVDQLAAEPSLRGYHLLPSVRGDLLMKLGRTAEARAGFERATALASNAKERELTAARAVSARGDDPPEPPGVGAPPTSPASF
jgi:RNA polymerase sigma factor (sigma-70 family)